MHKSVLVIVSALALGFVPVAIAAPHGGGGGGHFGGGGGGHFGGSGGGHFGGGGSGHFSGGGAHFGGGPHFGTRAAPHFAAPHFAGGSHFAGRPHFRHFAFRGSHFSRYRHRRGRFHYFYHGWWYAFPWWIGSNSDYYYWSHVCALRWGYHTYRYYRCMHYYGFY